VKINGVNEILFVAESASCVLRHWILAFSDSPAALNSGGEWRFAIEQNFEDLQAIMPHLASHGLVTETLTVEKAPSFSINRLNESLRTLKKILETPPKRHHDLSDFAKQFLPISRLNARPYETGFVPFVPIVRERVLQRSRNARLIV
jgi:hypothetical protein